ncbi:hypothetical protein HMPREF9163_00959 [Selenomonas sp. oral taxon 138 str. F0429]|nr:hypothetical protein HMPREF9163_00959 [Selenomonas sp. oral taxon 138 str. F0429]
MICGIRRGALPLFFHRRKQCPIYFFAFLFSSCYTMFSVMSCSRDELSTLLFLSVALLYDFM